MRVVALELALRRRLQHRFHRAQHMTAQAHLTHAIQAGEADRAARLLGILRLVRTRRLTTTCRQARLVHRRRITTRCRNHRQRRRGIPDRDRQRRHTRIAIRILDRVREHILHVSRGARVALVAVAAIRADRQLTVLAVDLRIRTDRLHIACANLHAHHRGTIRALRVVGQHIAHDRRIAAAGHAVRVQLRCRHIVHDAHRQLTVGRVSILVRQHHCKVLEQVVVARSCRMRLVVQQRVRVRRHARGRIVARDLQLVAQGRRDRLGREHIIRDDRHATHRQAGNAIHRLHLERARRRFCRARRIAALA